MTEYSQVPRQQFFNDKYEQKTVYVETFRKSKTYARIEQYLILIIEQFPKV